MKFFIIALVTLAALSTPILTFACPPPPAPGADTSESGDGPLPGSDHHSDGAVEASGADTGSGEIPVDCEVGAEEM